MSGRIRRIPKPAASLILALICAMLVDAGFHLRWWAWQASAHIHFEGDMENALRWGNRADKLGYLNLYSLVIQSRSKDDYVLDYPPLRLAVFTVWAKWLDRAAPDMVPSIPVDELKIPRFLRGLEPKHWRSEYRVNRPLLLFNTVMELAAALAAGLLVWQTIGSLWLAVTAGSFLWLNPGIWIDSWMHPAWDAWILPFYLWAIWAASRRQWMLSGVIMAVGSLFKGQLLLVVPVFLLRPAFQRDFLAVLRWIGGFALGAAVVVSPWLLTEYSDGRRTLNWPTIAILVGIVSLAILSRGFSRARFEGTLAVVAAGAIFSGAFFSTTALDWYRIGYEYGVEKYPDLEMGGSDCLAGILQQRYHLKADDVCFIFAPGLGDWRFSRVAVTIADILSLLYAGTLVAATVGLVLQLRRNSSRWLVAATTPWLLFFALGPRMHERYLLWAAGVGAIVIGDSLGMTLLVLVISAASALMILGELLGSSDGRRDFLRTAHGAWGPSLDRWIHEMYPDLGWALLLCAGIFLYQSLHPSGKQKTPTEVDNIYPGKALGRTKIAFPE